MAQQFGAQQFGRHSARIERQFPGDARERQVEPGRIKLVVVERHAAVDPERAEAGLKRQIQVKLQVCIAAHPDLIDEAAKTFSQRTVGHIVQHCGRRTAHRSVYFQHRSGEIIDYRNHPLHR